jgi:hypothetical protein
MQSFSRHLTYLWAVPPDHLPDPEEYDEMEPHYTDYIVPPYQPEYSTSPHSQVEHSFPHLMPFLENYKHEEKPTSPSSINITGSLSQSLSTNSDFSHSLSLSSSHPNLFVTPLSNSLPENASHCNGNSTGGGSDQIGLRIGSFPNLIPPSRTNYHDKARGLLPTFPIKGENTPTESEDDSDLSEGSDDDNAAGESGKRRSANASLPLSNDQQSKKTNMGTNQPKKRQRTSPSQLEVLEKVYQQEKLPSSELRKELAVKLKMTPRRVQVWFQNKRAKEKRMSISKIN